MHIGLDIHGVIDRHPEFFAEFTKLFINAGHQITILTGSHIEKMKVKEFLAERNISYTHLFSIADYHVETGTPMTHDTNGNPWIGNEEWDRTKGDYCKRNNIDICFDDTERYKDFFETPFVYTKFH